MISVRVTSIVHTMIDKKITQKQIRISFKAGVIPEVAEAI